MQKKLGWKSWNYVTNAKFLIGKSLSQLCRMGQGVGRRREFFPNIRKKWTFPLVSHILQSKCLALQKKKAMGSLVGMNHPLGIHTEHRLKRRCIAKCMCWNHSPPLPAQPHTLSLAHSRSHFWFVSCHLEHKQRRGARGEKQGGGGMGWRENETDFQWDPALPFTAQRTSLSHSLVCGSQPHLLLITETYFWKTASPGCSWVFFPALHIWFVFYCSGNIRHSQNKMMLRQHMD